MSVDHLVEELDRAGQRRHRRSGRGIFDAFGGKHAGVEAGQVIDPAPAIEIGRRQPPVGEGNAALPHRRVELRRRRGEEVVDRNHDEGDAGAPQARNVVFKPIWRRSSGRRTWRSPGGPGPRPGRRSGAARRTRRRERPLRHFTAHRTGLIFSSSTRPGRAGARLAVQRLGDRDGRADGRVAGEGQLVDGRKDAQPGRVRGVVRGL